VEHLAPDGERLENGVHNQVVVHGVVAGRTLISVSQPGGCSRVAGFSPDGQTLLTANCRSADSPSTACLWEIATGLPRLHVPLPPTVGKGDVLAFAFSADGRTLMLAGPRELLLVDVATGGVKLRRALGPDEDEVTAAAFSADGRRLATGLLNGTVLVWDAEAATRPERAALSERDREAWWAALARSDAQPASVAAGRLANDPEATVKLFRERLRPARPADGAAIQKLVAELGSPQFAVREAATRALAEFGEQTEPALKQALAGNGSAELRKRIERLLAQSAIVKSPEALRRLRAVQVLGWIGTAEARSELQRLSGGDPAARETQAARAALQ
ncbi:MAG: hypothetical protein ACJ8F7_18675, partial [Gemmataceae bacterium]